MLPSFHRSTPPLTRSGLFASRGWISTTHRRIEKFRSNMADTRKVFFFDIDNCVGLHLGTFCVSILANRRGPVVLEESVKSVMSFVLILMIYRQESA